jgi:hypothetical protein
MGQKKKKTAIKKTRWQLWKVGKKNAHTRWGRGRQGTGSRWREEKEGKRKEKVLTLGSLNVQGKKANNI